MLEKTFKLKENGTDVKTEVIAGITTFMAMAYILAVNPSILSATGMDGNRFICFYWNYLYGISCQLSFCSCSRPRT